MNHYYENIHGWFNFKNLYTNIVNQSNDGAHFVEVGTWQGQSAIYMAVEIINSNKKIKFDCVDTWEGSAEHANEESVKEKNLYNIFLENINPVKHIINPIKLSSMEAANLYSDNSLDFVFIDASHDYENVKNDILAWFPKVKTNGIIAGHDYDDHWSGVKKAVNEFIQNNNYKLSIEQETCWGIKK